MYSRNIVFSRPTNARICAGLGTWHHHLSKIDTKPTGAELCDWIRSIAQLVVLNVHDPWYQIHCGPRTLLVRKHEIVEPIYNRKGGYSIPRACHLPTEMAIIICWANSIRMMFSYEQTCKEMRLQLNKLHKDRLSWLFNLTTFYSVIYGAKSTRVSSSFVNQIGHIYYIVV